MVVVFVVTSVAILLILAVGYVLGAFLRFLIHPRRRAHRRR